MRSSKPHLGFREGNFRRGRLTNKTTNFTQTAKITHYTVFKTCLHNYVETHSTLCTPILCTCTAGFRWLMQQMHAVSQ